MKNVYTVNKMGPSATAKQSPADTRGHTGETYSHSLKIVSLLVCTVYCI